jgi:VanZ family protein
MSQLHLVDLFFSAAIGISVALEVVQLLVPERGTSFVDLTMNVLGASAGCLIGAVRLKRQAATRTALRAADSS